jgi:hypothetical protein
MTDERGRSGPEAIFIVGVSRSGTTLMRRVLESSSRIAIATENHFLGHLISREGAGRYFRSLGDAHDDRVIGDIVRYIYSDEYARHSRLRSTSPYWRWLVRKIDPADLERRLLASDRSDRGLFEAFMRVYADHRERPVMGEKTPAHLRYADTLFEWFPDGRLVHMVRDPRGIFVSELRRRLVRPDSFPYRQLQHVRPLFSLFVLLETTVVWADAADRHARLARRYPDRYTMVRFEDLVRQPRDTLTRVFDFLGVPMEEDVLRQKVVSKGFRQGQQGFDAGAAGRWRDQIGRPAVRWLDLTLRSRMERLGYGAAP